MDRRSKKKEIKDESLWFLRRGIEKLFRAFIKTF
jgi:hypothetical protein